MCCLFRINVTESERPKFRASVRLTFSIRVMGSVMLKLQVSVGLSIDFDTVLALGLGLWKI